MNTANTALMETTQGSLAEANAAGSSATTEGNSQQTSRSAPRSTRPKQNSPDWMRKYLPGLAALDPKKRMILMMVVPIIIAGIVTALIAGNKESYKVLYSNLSDADGGAIVTQLTQMNIPYEFAAGGSTIMIPEKSVHETRLRLANQGFPKASTVGYEIMDKQELGTTQFQEQVNYQRALEGELSRSIASYSSVESARVHLALPKRGSFFGSQEEKPTASVVVHLARGGSLSKNQIEAIAHLVSSSVPKMTSDSVVVTDQNGELLTRKQEENGAMTEEGKMGYISAIESRLNNRIIDILGAVYGKSNIKSSVTATVDFAQREQTDEIFKPNLTPETATVRSTRTSKQMNTDGTDPSGVPGTLSNQPQADANAVIGGQDGEDGAGKKSSSSSEEQINNYEVDKSVRYVKEDVGVITRLAAAVAVNFKTITNENGEVRQVQLTPEELEQVTRTVQEAIGFVAARGDTVNVLNQQFNREVFDSAEVGATAQAIEEAKNFAWPVVMIISVLAFILFVLRPMVKTERGYFGEPDPLMETNITPMIESTISPAQSLVIEQQEQARLAMRRKEEQAVEDLKSIAKEEPKIIAAVLKSWVAGEEG